MNSSFTAPTLLCYGDRGEPQECRVQQLEPARPRCDRQAPPRAHELPNKGVTDAGDRSRALELLQQAGFAPGRFTLRRLHSDQAHGSTVYDANSSSTGTIPSRVEMSRLTVTCHLLGMGTHTR